MPTTGQVIVFSQVPAGVMYIVTAPTRPRGNYHFRRADGSSATFDPRWAVRGAVWTVAA